MAYRTFNQNELKKGAYNALCDRCGFKMKNFDLKKEWNGLYTCRDCWEPRHPSDFQGEIDYTDNPSVPWTRPDTNANTSATAIDGTAIETDNEADTVGDADKTLRVDGTPRMNSLQHWNTTLTANRTVTLNTTSAVDGDSFTVQRTASGDFDLDVGGLQTADVPSVTVVTYRGSAWTLTSYTTIGI